MNGEPSARETALDGENNFLAELNGRLFSLRNRMVNALERLNGPQEEGPDANGSPIASPASGSINRLTERLHFTEEHIEALEAQMTVLERFI